MVTFCEADSKGQREIMQRAFAAAGYDYVTSVLSDPDLSGSAINGGVVIGSRWPILFEDGHIYRNACSDADCLAARVASGEAAR